MKSGKLRHRITIQSKVVSRDTFGAETITWRTEKTVWASIEPISGKEYFLAQQVQSEVTHVIKIRYYEGLRTDWRMLFGSRIFDVKSVINFQEQNVEMILMCREFVT
jgi:SPP1 family predicted phage head-tail adaptor